MPTDDLYTDDDRHRARDALGLSRFMGCDCCAEHPVCDHGEAFGCDVCEAAGIDPPDRIESLAAEVLDAVLPAIRVRWMKELAEGKADCFDLGWMARETEVNGLLETIERLRRQVDALDGHPDVRGTR